MSSGKGGCPPRRGCSNQPRSTHASWRTTPSNVTPLGVTMRAASLTARPSALLPPTSGLRSSDATSWVSSTTRAVYTRHSPTWGTKPRSNPSCPSGSNMPDTITIIDDRTGKQVTAPITDTIFPATAVRELDPSLFIYDPAYMQTAACQSAITYLDGEAGILRYRGYPIEQLAEHSTYLEVAYLLLNGELPDATQLAQWKNDVNSHTFIHENMRKRFVDGFHYDAHPMGMLISSIAALGTFYNEAKDIGNKVNRDKQILRLIAKLPTLAAMCYRFSVGLPFVYPDNNLSFPANFL